MTVEQIKKSSISDVSWSTEHGLREFALQLAIMNERAPRPVQRRCHLAPGHSGAHVWVEDSATAWYHDKCGAFSTVEEFNNARSQTDGK